MISSRAALPKAFQRTVLVSVFLHAGLIVLIAASPSFTRSPRRSGLVQYVNFIGGGVGGTGGGTGGGATVVAKTEPLPEAKKPALRDLTVPSKVKTEPQTALTHPVDKPKTTKKAPEKKAAISKPEPSPPTAADTVNAATEAATSGSGFGLRFGTGGGGSGGGTGGGIGGGTGAGAGDPFGISAFPFQFYLQMLSDRITANWFQALVDPGVGGLLQTQVYFRIYRDGSISDIKIDVSSGIDAFDLSARRAVQTAAPFAPLPNEYDGQYLGITLVFEHAK
ncbi:MAG: TonB family protein [Candidatus Aminicenantes bacterium]|nr:TonB family protein [Candidatus Aminicenantes bacterium]